LGRVPAALDVDHADGDINEASLGQVPSSNHAATADALGGIPSDGFVQGVGSESSTIAGSGAGFGSDALEVAHKRKLTLTCAHPAQAESRYTNESGGSQRI